MIEYGPATSSDANGIADLHTRSWRAHYRGEFPDDFLDGDLLAERKQVWSERLRHPQENQFVHVSRAREQLAGFVCAYGGHDSRWGSLIDNLHVSMSCKRSGIGARLMREAGCWLATYYPNIPVYLLVLESNRTARAFYETLGASNAQVSTMETNGGALVRSCHYTWSSSQVLSEA